MSKGLKALKKIEKEISRLCGMDIAYDGKVFDLFSIVGKELQALEIIKPLVRLEKDTQFCWLWIGMNGVQITEKQYDLLKEVLL